MLQFEMEGGQDVDAEEEGTAIPCTASRSDVGRQASEL